MGKKYNLASFRGRYGFSVVYGANDALGVGIAVSDGRGNFTAVQNTSVGGQVLRANITGTYTENPDGTGTASVSFTNPDGSTSRGTFETVVLEAKSTSSGLLATELQGITVIPGPGGRLGLTHFKSIP